MVGIYLRRWVAVNNPYIFKNLVIAIVINFFVNIAVKVDVFQNYTATRTAIFSLLMTAIWTGLFNTFCMFYSEASYVKADMAEYLPVSVYIISNAIIQFVLCASQAFIMTLFFGVFYRYTNEGVFFTRNIDFLISSFLVIYSSSMLGLFIGAFINDIKNALCVLPAILIVQMLFSGCLIPLDSAFLNQVSKLTMARFGYTAFSATVNLEVLLRREAAVNQFLQKELDSSLSAIEHSESNLLAAWVFLVVLSLIFLCASIISTKIVVRTHK